MSVHVDELSGARFKRAKKHIESIQQSPMEAAQPWLNEDMESNKSSSTFSVAQPTILNDARPTSVPTTDYVQHIPSEWSTADKLRQLIIWLGEKAIEEEEPKARPSAADKIKLAMIEKLKTSTNIITLHNNPDLLIPEGPNPIDVRNERILKEYREDIKIITDEIERWEKCEEAVFDKHAAATDKLQTARLNRENQSENFMDHIEPDQREYLDQFTFDEIDPEIIKRISKMDVEIPLLRQTMSIASHFNKQAAKLADNTKLELAHKVRENSRIVPLDADRRTLGLFEDTGTKRKEDEIQNVELSFRLLAGFSKEDMSMDLDD